MLNSNKQKLTPKVHNLLNIPSPAELLRENAEAWYLRGILLSSCNRYEEAIASFDVALKLEPNKQKAWYKIGLAYYSIGLYEEAAKNLRKAVELNAQDLSAWSLLKSSLLELEAYEEAQVISEKVLEIKNSHDSVKDVQKVTLYLPLGIHRQLKLRAVIDEESMSSLVEKAIAFYLKHPDNVKELESASYHHITQQVHISPECEAAMVMREGELVSLKYQIDVMNDDFPIETTESTSSEDNSEAPRATLI
jgi:tetratricopeptide (TPR) repeat protein